MSDKPALHEQAAAELLERFGIESLDLAMVLGSGWSSDASPGEELGRCEIAALPGFTAPNVTGHGGDVRCVRTPHGKIAAIFTGRTHLYENRGVDAVVHGVRAAAAAGARIMVLTNGAGSLRTEWAPGTPVLIRDHLNLTGQSPLAGPEFIDMSDTYSRRLRELVRSVEPTLPEAVYAQFRGPQYETPAEVRMAGVLGADLVGMSTALEAIAARASGVEVLGISLATNPAAGVSEEPLNHAEVLAAGREAQPRLAALLGRIIEVL